MRRSGNTLRKGPIPAFPRKRGKGPIKAPEMTRSLRIALAQFDFPVGAVAQNAERLHAGSEWHAHGFVFAQRTGLPIDSRADRRDWDQLLRDAGVRPARLHDARHTAATTLLVMGVPARVVMQILGHSQIGLTLGTYSHVVPELANDAADKIAQAYWK